MRPGYVRSRGLISDSFYFLPQIRPGEEVTRLDNILLDSNGNDHAPLKLPLPLQQQDEPRGGTRESPTKLVMVFSKAGKPIFAWPEEPEGFASIVATASGLLAFSADGGEDLRYIR